MFLCKLLLPMILVFYLTGGLAVDSHHTDIATPIQLEHTPIRVTTSETYDITGSIDANTESCILVINSKSENLDISSQKGSALNEFNRRVKLEKGANTIIIKTKSFNGDETSMVLQITRQ